jgi:hypothetical protein
MTCRSKFILNASFLWWQGLQLNRGFQKIGSFHHSMAQAHGVVGRSTV